jgi:UDPglucose 6-dehydrogenase
MKVCVVGLWHLGTVTAACLASAGHEVAGFDFDSERVEKLRAGEPPLYEPGLAQLVQQGIAQGRLRFCSEVTDALAGPRVVWVTYDTPVDEEDRANVDFVADGVIRLFPHLAEGSLILISSQLPVGTTRRLENSYTGIFPGKPVTFGYSPENLRLGKAIQAFTRPDRVVVGVRNPNDRARVAELFAPFTERIEWMSVESAEMTKHALNAFLANSVTFINEIAALCERVGADAKEVERGLKTDIRIGPRAYLSPGSAFAGGTLARDIRFLIQIGATHHQPTYLLSAVQESNEAHKNWSQRTMSFLLPDLCGQRIAVWGLTYKAGTDTLRRSASIELCVWIAQRGAHPQVHDPAIKVLPEGLAQKLTLHTDPLAALNGAAALVVATEWPVYQSIGADSVLALMRLPLVIDANRFLADNLGSDPRIRYFTVGKASL